MDNECNECKKQIEWPSDDLGVKGYWLLARNSTVQYQWCSKICLINGVTNIESESSSEEDSSDDDEYDENLIKNYDRSKPVLIHSPGSYDRGRPVVDDDNDESD